MLAGSLVSGKGSSIANTSCWDEAHPSLLKVRPQITYACFPPSRNVTYRWFMRFDP